MLVQHLRHPLERIDVRPGFWGLEWSCPSPWEVPEGIQRLDFEDGKQCFSIGFYCFFGWHFLKKAFRWYLKSDGPPFFGVTI